MNAFCAARNARAFARGEETDGFVVHVPGEVNVRGLRDRLGLSQAELGTRFGFGVAAVRDWQQGRRRPEAAARVLLMVIVHNPKAVEDALAFPIAPV